ncbi:MAG: hypothetical protein IIY79_05465, partial [Ruminococcus sp.]|nr:hypothetical protein [Ruminococcus sp.]
MQKFRSPEGVTDTKRLLLLPNRGKPCHCILYHKMMSVLPQGFGTPLLPFSFKENASIGGLDATSRCRIGCNVTLPDRMQRHVAGSDA